MIKKLNEAGAAHAAGSEGILVVVDPGFTDASR
jgi:hypothetical protein